MRKLYIIILLSFIGLSFNANAQIVNIPDANFKAALIAAGVHDSAGYITVDTARAFKGKLLMWYSNIADLTGIQAFTALDSLYCGGNSLTNLDLSSNTALTYLDCSQNWLDSLNVSSNIALRHLECEGNYLTSLNTSSNVALIVLDCLGNGLTSLDLSYNTQLSFLECSQNFLTTLDLSSDTALYLLNCADNWLTNLNVSSNTALTFLGCSFNQLRSLNVKNANNRKLPDSSFYSNNNPNLTCIQVDDTAYSKANWTSIDSTAHFSTDCNYVGINELTAVADLNIYPNPVSSQLIIETNGLKAASINIYNMLGEIVNCKQATGDRIIIDMSREPAGVYIVQITDGISNGSGRWSQMIVKE